MSKLSNNKGISNLILLIMIFITDFEAKKMFPLSSFRNTLDDIVSKLSKLKHTYPDEIFDHSRIILVSDFAILLNFLNAFLFCFFL